MVSVVVSLVVNIAVLFPVCIGIMLDASWAGEFLGPRYPARDILVAVYLAILIGSCTLLALIACADHPSVRLLTKGAILGMLGIQVVYKLITTISVQASVQNHVVATNLGITIIHMASSVLLATSIRRELVSEASAKKGS